MTEPLEPRPTELSYASAPRYQRASLLVRLAGIFTLCTAALDLISAVLYIVLLVFMYHALTSASSLTMPATASSMPATFPARAFMNILSAEYIGFSLLAISVAIVKLIGGVKLLRLSKNAWGWGLAAGIVGCFELWCSIGCIIPLGAGIYTIVILCLEDVRRFIAAPPEQRNFSEVPGHFPVDPKPPS